MQVARLRAESQARLMDLASKHAADDQTAPESSGNGRRGSLGLEAFNETRSIYGLPPWTEKEWSLLQGSGKGN